MRAQDPAGRARVRSIAQLVCCDIQPLQNTVLAEYSPESFNSKDFGIFWVKRHLPKIEAMLSSPEVGDFCHGQSPSMADACLIPQVSYSLLGLIGNLHAESQRLRLLMQLPGLELLESKTRLHGYDSVSKHLAHLQQLLGKCGFPSSPA